MNPKHIALIPDGNRRWAKQKGMISSMGHYHGMNAAITIMKYLINEDIEYISFWGISQDNIKKRDNKEVQYLFKIFETMFKKIKNDKDIHNNEVRVTIIGDWKKLFPESAKKEMQEAIDKTKKYKKHNLNFLLAYSGKKEMLDAIKKIKKPITEENLKKALHTKNLPPVDLLIRTGGEPHNSDGFMMWDIANSQYYFTKKYWPDFNEKEAKKALKEYAKRGKRLGS